MNSGGRLGEHPAKSDGTRGGWGDCNKGGCWAWEATLVRYSGRTNIEMAVLKC